jgi:hypothetical protein
MAFIELTENGVNIDDSVFSTKSITDAFGSLIEQNGFDRGKLACGVSPSPDFGYFELADRFWRAALCIYALGATNCFWERGAGYAEPWLFNARHAVELYIKGLLLNAIWLEELQSNPHLSVSKEEFANLRRELGKPHNLLDLYNKYRAKITEVIANWNTSEIPETPEVDCLVLKPEEMEVLKELDETDKTSFRFRYPSFKQQDKDFLQKLNWQHDSSMLLPKTGLPKESGYFFNHVEVMNHLYQVISQLKAIEDYYRGIADYQDVMNEYWSDYVSEFSNEGYGY